MRWWRRWRAERKYQHWLNGVQHEPEEFIDFSVCDWAPEDLLLCGSCGGHGAIKVRTDWETGADEIEACVRCRRTGLDPIQVPHWAVAVAT